MRKGVSGCGLVLSWPQAPALVAWRRGRYGLAGAVADWQHGVSVVPFVTPVFSELATRWRRRLRLNTGTTEKKTAFKHWHLILTEEKAEVNDRDE